mmetsp:Transcript_23218/g.34199  ORF Transcript_23218/g.34199 Transcript_23218/m.34199 type:complete len:222 (-) Transcript_23218:964-1629(-)
MPVPSRRGFASSAPTPSPTSAKRASGSTAAWTTPAQATKASPTTSPCRSTNTTSCPASTKSAKIRPTRVPSIGPKSCSLCGREDCLTNSTRSHSAPRAGPSWAVCSKKKIRSAPRQPTTPTPIGCSSTPINKTPRLPCSLFMNSIPNLDWYRTGMVRYQITKVARWKLKCLDWHLFQILQLRRIMLFLYSLLLLPMECSFSCPKILPSLAFLNPSLLSSTL